jgi:hypothetical protein
MTCYNSEEIMINNKYNIYLIYRFWFPNLEICNLTFQNFKIYHLYGKMPIPQFRQ